MAEGGVGIVIVGAGMAGAKTAEALREQGYAGDVTLIGAEPELPYERPPLSKDYLAGRALFDAAVIHPAEWYVENRINLELDVRVESLDRQARTVTLTDARTIAYDHLVLATGSHPRPLPVPGADAAGVLYLRDRADADTVRSALQADRRLVIIGAGWIGLEVAAVARDAGVLVTIVDKAELPLVALFGPEIGGVFADLQRAHGVELIFGADVLEITETNGVAGGVRLGDGTVLPADAVLVAIGALPDVALAEAAGLEVSNGVLVDAALRTSDSRIFAVGDIANQLHPLLQVRVRVEHWATALDQPATAAAAILGAPASFEALPYFFSDQYDLGLEYLGHVPRDCPTRLAVRGDLALREFVAFWLDETDRIRAAMNVNVWDVVDEVRPLITGHVRVDPARLTDLSVPLGDTGADLPCSAVRSGKEAL